jgi:hypothetical protein
MSDLSTEAKQPFASATPNTQPVLPIPVVVIPKLPPPEPVKQEIPLQTVETVPQPKPVFQIAPNVVPEPTTETPSLYPNIGQLISNIAPEPKPVQATVPVQAPIPEPTAEPKIPVSKPKERRMSVVSSSRLSGAHHPINVKDLEKTPSKDGDTRSEVKTLFPRPESIPSNKIPVSKSIEKESKPIENRRHSMVKPIHIPKPRVSLSGEEKEKENRKPPVPLSPKKPPVPASPKKEKAEVPASPKKTTGTSGAGKKEESDSLSGIDPKLQEVITSEILDKSTKVKFADIGKEYHFVNNYSGFEECQKSFARNSDLASIQTRYLLWAQEPSKRNIVFWTSWQWKDAVSKGCRL